MSKIPIYISIYEQFKHMIKEGVYKEQEKLPSKRKLSAAFKVSPLTIESAYNQLIAEGYIYAIEKKGYFVSKQIELLKSNKSIKKEIILENNQEIKYPYPFKTNVVDTDLFPHATWAKLSREVLADKRYEMLNEVDPKGLLELRMEIKRYLELYRGIDVDSNQIIIGTGSNILMHMMIDLLGRKKHYGMEDPGYERIASVFKRNDIKYSNIPLDDQGLDVNALKKSKVEVIHITPSHQFPTGIVMPIQRRTELLNWAIEKDSYIIEDDYDSEFRYLGKPIPTLFSLDQNERIIYMNTFTKTLAPSLRIGYIVLPIHLLNSYQDICSYHSCSVPNFEQSILSKFIKYGHYERHMNKMRNIYRQKIEKIIDIFNHEPLFELFGYDSGLHFVLNIKKEINPKDLISYLREKGIFIQALVNENNHLTSLVVGYSGIPKEDIVEHFSYLKESILSFLNK